MIITRWRYPRRTFLRGLGCDLRAAVSRRDGPGVVGDGEDAPPSRCAGSASSTARTASR